MFIAMDFLPLVDNSLGAPTSLVWLFPRLMKCGNDFRKRRKEMLSNQTREAGASSDLTIREREKIHPNGSSSSSGKFYTFRLASYHYSNVAIQSSRFNSSSYVSSLVYPEVNTFTDIFAASLSLLLQGHLHIPLQPRT